MNKVALLEFMGLVFDTGMILEDELEDGRRTLLDKIDRDSYENMPTYKSAQKQGVTGCSIYLSSEYICSQERSAQGSNGCRGSIANRASS